MKTNQLLSKTICAAMFAGAMLLSSSLFAQVKIGTNPTLIESNSNLEIEASTGSRKVKVDKASGQLTVKDGTEGVGKILVSDANGGASWQDPSILHIPQTYFTGSYSGNQVVTTNVGLPHKRLDFSVVSPIGSWTNNEYTITTSGTYKFEFNGALYNYVAGKTFYNQFVALYAGSLNQAQNIQTAYSGVGVGSSLTGNFVAGDKVIVYVYSFAPDAVTLIADQMTIVNASLVITKL